ncbi:FAD-binding protein [Micromonospora sp. NPDC093277]|uniref:FAD-dependent oxidoreductase n=1 Tax=Micromonospora sp. NPDC093277 TaxID=3364291 RepID=UPI003802C52D
MTRRALLAGTAAVGGSLVTRGTPAVASTETIPSPLYTTVRTEDFRYDDLVRGRNVRFVSTPEYVRLVQTPDDVVGAVRAAVAAGKRIAVRSGGHCYEDFVDNAETEVILDLSGMRAVYYDATRRAFAVEPGATLGSVYEALFKGWGVTVPGGSCPSVAFGGQVAGGGYGQLNRSHGLLVDYLDAVEVVVIRANRTVQKVIASSAANDPNRDLWWGHTGGGGGNFGVVTRYWFKTPGAIGSDPTTLLPRPPHELWINQVAWPWAMLTEADFGRLVGNFGNWCERNSSPGSPWTKLFSRLLLNHQANGTINMVTQIDAALPGAERMIQEFVAAVGAGIPAPQVWDHRRLPWLHTTTWSAMFGGDATGRADFKSAYMRTAFPASHIAAFYRHLTSPDYRNPVTILQLSTYGGQTNTVSPTATAVSQRDSVMKMHYLVGWGNEAEDALHIGYLRRFYRDVYAGTGGVPVPNAVTDGCYINYADIDLSNPEWNTSGVPWHHLYYKNNYPSLQQVKARWDPTDAFRHAQSIRLPS